MVELGLDLMGAKLIYGTCNYVYILVFIHKFVWSGIKLLLKKIILSIFFNILQGHNKK